MTKLEQFRYYRKILQTQECIPVGCVPTSSVASIRCTVRESLSGVSVQRVSVQGVSVGESLSRWCLPRGFLLGSLCQGREGSVQGDLCRAYLCLGDQCPGVSLQMGFYRGGGGVSVTETYIS